MGSHFESSLQTSLKLTGHIGHNKTLAYKMAAFSRAIWTQCKNAAPVTADSCRSEKVNIAQKGSRGLQRQNTEYW